MTGNHLLPVVKAAFIAIICCWVVPSSAQPDPHAIWEQLLKANGEGDFPPVLEVQELGNKGPAYYSRRTVYLEESLPAKLDSAFGDQAESALSYVLAHELAHHNRDHICSHFIRRGMKGTETGELLRDADQRRADSRKHESEADLLAGLYGHIAGFRPLDVADSVLSFIYGLYDLPDSIPGYPSLGERQTIADNARNQLDQVALAYDMAWTTCALGMYEPSAHLLETILIETKYNAPEVYELLALTNFLSAVELISKEYPNIAQWGWPIQLSHETNARSTTRGASQEDWAAIKKILEEAEKWAQRGLELNTVESKDEGLIRSIQYLMAWADAPDTFLKNTSKTKGLDDIETNLQALSLWLLNPEKNTKKVSGLLSNCSHPSSALNLRLLQPAEEISTTANSHLCDKLNTKQQKHMLLRPTTNTDKVLLGKTLVFSREKTEDGWDIQFGTGVKAPRLLTWVKPFHAPFCWSFETGKTTMNDVLVEFNGIPYRQLSLHQGSFISFPQQNLAFRFDVNGTLASISWNSPDP